MPDLRSLFDLTGQVALITGGSRGLGLEMAEGLAEAGASLFLLARRDEWLTPAVDEMRAKGFRCEGMLCDVGEPAQVEAAVSRTVDTFGGLDILVNNAGVSWGALSEDMPLDKWKMVLDINLTGAFLFCQAAGRVMIARKRGSIINIASINGVQGGLIMKDTHNAGYVASKAGLIGLTRMLAAKWAQHGIRVNAISPGYFPTRLTERIWENVKEKVAADVPMGRGGGEGELKGVAVFLAAAASSYVTGQNIIVDGGTTLV